MPTFNATFLFVLISFAVFTVIMKAVYFAPIMAIKHKREQKLTDDQQLTADFLTRLEELQTDYEAGIKQAHLEAHQIIQQIRQQSKTSAQQMVIESRAVAQREADQKLSELHQWRESTYQQMEPERASLTQSVIAKVKAGSKLRTVTGS
jgi:F0F1-type ATP synthase membrane subunit b/b'